MYPGAARSAALIDPRRRDVLADANWTTRRSATAASCRLAPARVQRASARRWARRRPASARGRCGRRRGGGGATATITSRCARQLQDLAGIDPVRIFDDVGVEPIDLGPQERIAEIGLAMSQSVSPRLTVCVAGHRRRGLLRGERMTGAPTAMAKCGKSDDADRELRAVDCGRAARA